MENKTLRLVLGDQLNAQHSWFKQKTDNVIYLIAELYDEQTYVNHHIQKTQAFFLAMRNFAEALKKADHQVHYLTLNDTESQSLKEVIKAQIKQHQISKFEYQQPDEYRLSKDLASLKEDLEPVEVTVHSTEHFFVEYENLSNYFKPNTAHRMEAFYRKMRVEHDILLKNGEPVGGKWNYDADNRNKLKKGDIKDIPEPVLFPCDEDKLNEINARLKKWEVQTIGHQATTWIWPTTRAQAIELLEYFLKHCLSKFGEYQDAMTCAIDENEETLWSLYHCRLSFSLNTKMISPKMVIDAAVNEFEKRDDISIQQIEGFVRQILGWREFVRGIYWLNMPEYKSLNNLNAQRSMPAFFWNAKTKMKCLSHSIQQSLDYAYAHHIQRLMVIGNFAFLCGIHPDEVDNWYLGIYIDAIEWVELPNTRGMSQFADGGLLASKAYAASGNYINKMSDYCANCQYKVKEKVGESACPFNALYWNFMAKHEDEFSKNPRQSMVYRNWNKKCEDEREALINRAQWILENLDTV